MWRLQQNPDNFCIPLLTALGDLLGTALLLFCFYLVFLTGNTNIKTLNHGLVNQTNSTLNDYDDYLLN